MSVAASIPRVVCAPMAGGPSTVELAAAVCAAGGLGFLAGGYLTADALTTQIVELRARTDGAFGVNLFVVREQPVDEAALAAYVASLEPDALRLRVALGRARFDDDGLAAKLELLHCLPVSVVSFTFGCPKAATVRDLQSVGTSVWVTVATVDDARQAIESGCDALVVQGREAGGHRAAFIDDGGLDALDTLELVTRVTRITNLPIVAAGGIATAAHARAAHAAGACAVQAGTAFLLTPEAGTHPLQRAAIASSAPTAFTRAFSGRTARGIDNAFMRAHRNAPSAYPQVHHVTAPLRAAARAAGASGDVSLWAGARHELAQPVAAAQVVAELDACDAP